MNAITMMELMRLTRVELLDRKADLLALIEALPEDVADHVTARANLCLVRRVLVLRHAQIRISGPSP